MCGDNWCLVPVSEHGQHYCVSKFVPNKTHPNHCEAQPKGDDHRRPNFVEKRLHREEAVSRKRHSYIFIKQTLRALVNLTYWQPAPNVTSGHGFIGLHCLRRTAKYAHAFGLDRAATGDPYACTAFSALAHERVRVRHRQFVDARTREHVGRFGLGHELRHNCYPANKLAPLQSRSRVANWGGV